MPITFDVSVKPATVISVLVFGNRVLIRRTDFNNNRYPIKIRLGTKDVLVDYAPGASKILTLK